MADDDVAADQPALTQDAETTGSASPTGPENETAAEQQESATSASAPAVSADADGGVATRPNRRKVREGLVISIKMDKTAVVGVIERVRHPRYAKTVQRTKRLYVHDEANDVRVGDRVRVAETRPLSKLKRWRLVEVLERAK
jgi:small subunit ribosomal protein S17